MKILHNGVSRFQKGILFCKDVPSGDPTTSVPPRIRDIANQVEFDLLPYSAGEDAGSVYKYLLA
jgi:hypothetical protein